MAITLTVTTLLATLTIAWGYKLGAPEGVCEDMTPQHGVDPQTKTFPYSITVDKDEVKPGQNVEITVSGKPFKGFLIQVRDGDKAVGSFNIPADHEYAKTVRCFEGETSAATHKNASDKKSVILNWVPPPGAGKTYTVYATIVETGAVYWVKKPTATIKVN